jgi:hypothetical protein
MGGVVGGVSDRLFTPQSHQLDLGRILPFHTCYGIGRS